jgi:hypothetical protein
VTAATLARVHGGFYIATGLWPLVSMRTFELASGPKKEKWLVKTMGALIAAVGGALLVGARVSGDPPAERGLGGAPPPRGVHPVTLALGVLSAGTLAACDVVYVAKGRTAKSYLLDAAVEVALVGAWANLARVARRVRVTA